jgi:hypothetical protein
MSSFIILALHKILSGWSSQGRGYDGDVARVWEITNAYKIFVAKPEGLLRVLSVDE